MKKGTSLRTLEMLLTLVEPVLQSRARQKYPFIQVQLNRFIKQVCGFFDISASIAKSKML